MSPTKESSTTRSANSVVTKYGAHKSEEPTTVEIMAPSKLTPTERLMRKRLAARLRQQRCRARKRIAAAAAMTSEDAPKAKTNKTTSTLLKPTSTSAVKHSLQSCDEKRAKKMAAMCRKIRNYPSDIDFAAGASTMRLTSAAERDLLAYHESRAMMGAPWSSPRMTNTLCAEQRRFDELYLCSPSPSKATGPSPSLRPTEETAVNAMLALGHPSEGTPTECMERVLLPADVSARLPTSRLQHLSQTTLPMSRPRLASLWQQQQQQLMEQEEIALARAMLNKARLQGLYGPMLRQSLLEEMVSPNPRFAVAEKGEPMYILLKRPSPRSLPLLHI